MKRTAMEFLEKWLLSKDRKPLIIRGARQVGKTWLVRYLAKEHNRTLIEVNVEKRPDLAAVLTSNEPKEMLLNLGAALKQHIIPEQSLLFFDEVQTAPIIIAKLRWFAEEMPELAVIATGSLLEFALRTFPYSMPVGRISYMFLEPLSFKEFLWATENEQLVKYLEAYELSSEIPAALHGMLMKLFKEYIIVGGMPQAVKSWISHQSLPALSQVHQEILGTYRDDFNKYSGKLPVERLDEVMLAVPRFVGQKFVYSRVNPLVPINAIKQALDLLAKARICHRVVSSYANGLPLGAEVNRKYLKVIYLDVGLCSAALDLSLDTVNRIEEISLINSGGIAEQVVGQLLRTIRPFYIDPALYYWQREEKGSSAEIDYVIQHKQNVVPLEVKAGSTGTLKSLHLFMGIKNYSFGVRINSALPTQSDINVKDYAGKTVQYKLLSMPFYLISELHRLLP